MLSKETMNLMDTINAELTTESDSEYESDFENPMRFSKRKSTDVKLKYKKKMNSKIINMFDDEAIRFMSYTDECHEVFTYDIVPYFDIEHQKLYDNKKDMIETVKRTIQVMNDFIKTNFIESVFKHTNFMPNIEELDIHFLNASGKTDKGYKVSLHCIIRNMGYFKKQYHLKTIVDYAMKSYRFNGKKIDLSFIDLAVYNNDADKEKIQSLRMPFCKKADGSRQLVYQNYKIYKSSGKAKLLSTINDANDYDEPLNLLAGYIEEEDELHFINKEQPKKITKQGIKNDLSVSGDSFKNLLRIFLNDEDEQDLSWDEWSKMIWAIKISCDDLNLDAKKFAHWFSSKSDKYDYEQCEEAINKAWSRDNAKGEVLTIASIIMWAKEIDENAVIQWLEDNNELSTINADDDYTWFQFRKQYRNKLFNNKNEMLHVLQKDLSRVLAFITEGASFFVKKDDCNEKMFNIIKTKDLTRGGNDFYIKYNETVKDKEGNDKNKITSIKFSTIIFDIVREYSCVDFLPNTKDKDVFNLFRGYVAKIPTDGYNYDEIDGLLNFIKEIICANDDKLYDWFMSWLAWIMVHPEHRAGVAPVLISTKQGTGKGTLVEFIEKYLIGESSSIQLSGVESLTCRFNEHLLGRKFIMVNEMSSTKAQFAKNFERLKEIITDENTNIEPKGLKTIKVKNLTNYIFMSNHKDSMIIESSDRRYVCFEVSDKHAQDFDYFTELRDKYFNQRTGDIFYAYLLERCPDKIKQVLKLPKTKLKEEIQLLNANSRDLFIRDCKEQMDEEVEDADLIIDENNIKYYKEKGLIPVKKLYEIYVIFCQDNNFHCYNSAKFKNYIKNKISKKRTNRGFRYNLNTINIE